MNLLDRAIGYVAPATALRRAQARRYLAAAVRSYDAGRPSRSTVGWRRPFTSARSETYQALPFLRASAHDLARNNPHVSKVVAGIAKDFVGTGIMPRAKTGRKALDKKVDAVMADLFGAIDVDGVCRNYPAFQLLAARTLLEGGEAVFRRYVRPTRLGLTVPLQFALMEGEFIDNLFNAVLPNGNRIVQGIEFDPVQRTREAYWMFREHPGDAYMAAPGDALERVRVPADDVRLMMEPQRPGQIRGVPWITPILVRAKLLDDYEDAERQRKRMESSVPLIVKNATQVGEASEGQGPSLFPTMTDADGNTIEVVEPALVAYLRDSSGVEALTPAEAAGFVPYKRAELQSVAAGARSTYELTSGDLSQTSFSSINFGTLDYRGMIDVMRGALLIPDFEWMWRCGIDVATARGLLPEGTPYGVEHHCPPWIPVDPLKAADADKTAIRSGTKSLYEVVTARGKDFAEHVAEIARSNKLLDRYGLVLDSDPRRTDGRGVDQAIAADVKGELPAPASDLSDDDQKLGLQGQGSDDAGHDHGEIYNASSA